MKITKKTATRDSYGKALVSLGEKDDRVVVLEADLAGATKLLISASGFRSAILNVELLKRI